MLRSASAWVPVHPGILERNKRLLRAGLLWVEVEGGGVSHIASGIVGYDRDIIAYLALVRIAFERIKRIAHRNVRRPGHAGVSAIGIEKLRVGVVSSVSRVIPNSIEPSIGRYRKCAEPVPLARVNRVVIDLVRRTEGYSAICAAHKHHVGCASPGRHHAGQHVNVIVSRTTGAINRQETQSSQSCWIDSPATEVATHVDRGYWSKVGVWPPICALLERTQ